MDNNTLSIRESFSEKVIFVVGGSGFIGKVWLAMMLDFVPDFKKVYVLVRASKGKNAIDRFADIYSSSPVFSHLHDVYGKNIRDIKKIEVLEGDVTSSKFGLKDDEYKKILSQVDITLNFAADLRFNAPLDEMLKSNSEGPLNVAAFILSSKKAKLLHISTCYVAGMSDGIVEESLSKQISPNGTVFSAEEEFNWAKQEGLAARARDASKEELKNIGIFRAKRLGWPNTYTYTKALGEILLSNALPKERLSIFRPSIVESSAEYPFPGWNEDFNGTAPLVHLFSTRYRVLIAKPEHKLDIIPVDYVAKGLSIAACALLNETHAEIYQSATSSINPLTIETTSEIVVKIFREDEKKKLHGLLLPYPKAKFVEPEHILSGHSLRRMESTVSRFVDKISNEKNMAKFISRSGLKNVIRFIKRKALIIDTIAKVYRPFVYDYNYTFKGDNLLSHRVIEKEFTYTPSDIEWNKYWRDAHIPGLKRWCIPLLKSLNGENK